MSVTKVSVRIRLAEISRDLGVLSGTLRGRKTFARLVSQLSEDVEPGIIALDFVGVEHASASFLREAVMPFRDYIRGYLPDSYPVLFNASPSIQEELDVVLKARREALANCQERPDGTVETGFIGDVEPSLRRTLERLQQEPASIAQLVAESREEISRTAWHHRINALTEMGLIRSHGAGRDRAYACVFVGPAQ